MTVSVREVPFLVAHAFDEIAEIRDPRERAEALAAFRTAARAEYNDRLRACCVELRRKPLTLREVGEVVGLSHEQVRRLLAGEDDVTLLGRRLEKNGRPAY